MQAQRNYHMTSRYIDIKCIGCRTYLFSLQPNDYTEMGKVHHCDKPTCKEAAVFTVLKGPEPSLTKKEMMDILAGSGKLHKIFKECFPQTNKTSNH